MSRLPSVAIIGKPNVGKSRLFNRIVGHRRAIVSEVPGTTRDQVTTMVRGEAVDYILIDTGGIGGGSEDIELEADVAKQSLLALEHADVIVLVFSSIDGITAADHKAIEILRKKARRHVPVVVAVNKCDNPDLIDGLLPEFISLGIGQTVLGISAAHNAGIAELQDEIEEQLQSLHFSKHETDEYKNYPRIAIIGKPNAGKSSLVNALMPDSQRQKTELLVSDIPGTTRDSVDTFIRHEGQEYIFVDTAGIKRLKQTDEGIEAFAYLRSLQAIEHADIVALVLDVTVPISRQDKRIAGLAIESGKGLVLLMNKADKLNKEQKKDFEKEVKIHLPFCEFIPKIFCSAKDKTNILKIFDQLGMIHANRTRRLPTNQLNNWFKDILYGRSMHALAKAKHIVQAEGVPPTFIVFVRDPKQIQVSQLRYLENKLRQIHAFEGTPIRFITKKQELKKKES